MGVLAFRLPSEFLYNFNYYLQIVNYYNPIGKPFYNWLIINSELAIHLSKVQAGYTVRGYARIPYDL
jgi:hypothetical protein